MKKDSVGSVMADPSAFRTEVRMASVQVSGLTRREIEMALAYEVEPISLIPASEAQVDFNQIEGDDPAVVRYSVAVRRRAKGKTISGKRPVKILVALGVLILAFIAVDAVVLSRSISSLESEKFRRAHLDAQIKAARREESSLRAETARLKAEREAVVASHNKVASLRSAWPKVLKSLASSCDGKAVVTSIESREPFKLKLYATAVSSAAAAEVTALFSSVAAKEGWRVIPGSTVSISEEATARFDCEVTYD